VPKRYERTQKRKGYRNGYYRRDLLTKYGNVEDIQVPRVIGLPVEYDVFARYRRRAASREAAIGWSVSQRHLHPQAAQALPGIFSAPPVSAQTVSKCTAYLEEELRHYQQRPLTDDVEFLFLDGITESG